MESVHLALKVLRPVLANVFFVFITIGCIPLASPLQADQKKGIQIGVVTLIEVPAGQETSGSVVTDPQAYNEIPALRVLTAEVPQLQGQVLPNGSSSNSGTLEGVVVDMGDGRKQPGDKPLTWIPQPGTAFQLVTLFLRDRPETPIATGKVPVEPAAPPIYAGPGTPGIPFRGKPVSDTQTGTMIPASDSPRPVAIAPSPTLAPQGPYTMPAVGTQGGVHIIHGDTVGNSSKMWITVDDTPAKIVAAKPGTVLWRIPETASAGPHEVAFFPGRGKTPVKLRIYVLGLTMNADRTQLIKGQSTRMHVSVTGLDGLPASLWHTELPPAELVDVKRWEQRTGLHAPTASELGSVVLIVENRSPQTIRMGSHGDRIVLQLHQRDFSKGAYVYEDKLQSLQSGGFAIHGTVTAFLSQIVGRPEQQLSVFSEAEKRPASALQAPTAGKAQ